MAADDPMFTVTRGEGICKSKSNAAALGTEVVVAFDVVVLSSVEVVTVVVATGCTDVVELVIGVGVGVDVVDGVVDVVVGRVTAVAASAVVAGGVTDPSTTLLRRTVAVGTLV
jgi:hypothetical protein